MKLLKKLFVVLFVAFATLVVVGCDGNEPVDLYEEFLEIANAYDKENIVSDLNLPATKGDIQITWSSSNPAVVSNEGVVTRQKEDVKVKLTAIMKQGEITQNFFFEVTVKAVEITEDNSDKISDVIAGADGTNYVIKGTVVAVNAQSFMVQDATGIILVYKGFDWVADVAVGDVVTVNGPSTTYGAAKQFDKTSTYEKVSSGTFTQPTAKELTVAEIDAYATAELVAPIYVKITGKLSTSTNDKGTTYYNLELPGASITGSISYPKDGEALVALSGKNLEIYAYVNGVTGSSKKYLNFMVVSYKEVEGIDVPAETKTISEVLASENGLYTTEGSVAAINARGFVLVDDASAILVYLGSKWTCDVTVGDKLLVTGTTTEYGGAKQFGESTTYNKSTNESFNYSTPNVLDGAKVTEIAGQATVTIQYVQITGTLAISGNYVNITIADTELTGSITYPADMDALKEFEGKKVVIDGYYTGVSSSKYFNLMYTKIEAAATAPAVEKANISEVLAAETDAAYIVKGTVVALNKRGFILADNTAAILVYTGGEWTADVAVGDKLTVTGTTAKYAKAIQFESGVTYAKDGTEEVTAPTPVALDGTKMNELAEASKVAIQYVKVEGLLNIDGNYYNITFNGTTLTGSVTYPIDTTVLATFDGKSVAVEGYFTGIHASSSTGKTFFNIMGVSYSASDVVVEKPVEPGKTPDPETTPITLVTKDLGYTNQQEFTTWTDATSVVTISADKASNTNTPKYFNSGEAVRVYAGSVLKVSATADLDQVIFEITYKDLSFASLVVTGGTLEETDNGFKVVANEGVKEVTISTTGTKGHIKYVAISTYTK